MMGKIKDWTLKYINYKEVPKLAEEESGKGTYLDGFILLLLSQVMNAIAFAIAFPISLLFNPIPFAPEQLLISLAVLSLIGMVAFYVIGFTIFLVGALLGGRGTPENLLYLLSVMNLCSRTITVPFVILSSVEPIAFVILLVISAIGLYGIYAVYLAVRKSLSLSPVRAAAALLASIVVVILVLAVVGASVGGM